MKKLVLKRKVVTVFDPKKEALKKAITAYQKHKEASEELEEIKNHLKKDVFPYGVPVGEASHRYTFGVDEGEYAGASVTCQERRSTSLDEEAATAILKAKRLYSACLTTPEPPPPPKPFLDIEKIQQLMAEGKISPAEVKKMIKMSRPTYAITIGLPKKAK